MMGSPCLSTCVQMTTGRLLCEDTLAALRPLVTRMASLLLTPATTCTNQGSPSGHVTCVHQSQLTSTASPCSGSSTESYRRNR